MLPDFNRLKVFYHVYRLLSISAAAETLHLSQSAVSQQIHKLEDELRTPLFTRMPRRLIATQSGELLFARVHPFVVGLEQGLQEIQSSRTHPCGLLRVGAPATLGEIALPRFIADYRLTYPEVRFHLVLGHPSLLLPSVHQGNLDLAFADIFSSDDGRPTEKNGLSIQPLVEEKLILVCSTPYFHQQLKGSSTSAFIHGTFIAYHPLAPALRSWLKHHHGHQGHYDRHDHSDSSGHNGHSGHNGYHDSASVKPDIVLSVESVRAVITAVEHHMGLAVVPAHLVQEALDKGDLTTISASRTELINRIAVVQLVNKIPSVTEKTFIRHVERSWYKQFP